MEYCIYGDSLSDLSKLLDSTVAVPNSATESNQYILRIKTHPQVLSSIDVWYLQESQTSSTSSPFCTQTTVQSSSLVPALNNEQSISTSALPISVEETESAFKHPNNALLRFVNASVLSRGFAAGHLDFKPDYRRISVLFVKLNGDFDVDNIQTALKAFIDAVSACNGVFQHFSVDDKGQNMLAFFGLPPFVHENSALFAAKAATKFAKDYKRRNVYIPNISVGTGDCLNELIGTVERKEIFIMVDIKIDSETKELVRNDFACHDLGSIIVKGKEDPIQVWGLSNSVKAPLKDLNNKPSSESYIGYAAESLKLFEGFCGWKEKKVGFRSLIQGESGTGKSCLMSRISMQIMDLGANIFMVRGSEVEQWTPYFGLQPVICKILQLKANQSPHQVKEKKEYQSMASSITELGKGKSFEILEFERLLVDCGESPQYAALLAHTLPWLKFTTVEAVEKLTTSAKAVIIESLFLKLLDRFLADDCVLVIDDAQWIDSISMNIYHHLIEKGGAHCCFVFSRPVTSDVQNGLDKIRDLSSVTNLEISGFGIEDTAVLMLRHLRADRISDTIIEAVYNRTAGNIIQTQMICESLHSRKEAIFEDALILYGIKDMTMFESIVNGSSTSIVSAQLDRLSAQFNKLLKASSVLGQYFCLEEVAHLYLPDVISVEELVELIVKEDFFHYLSFSVNGLDGGGDTVAGKTFCSFRHIRLMHAIYDSISLAERSVLHERIAEYYEVEGVANENVRKQLLPTLQHHYSKTSNVVKMVNYAEELANVNFNLEILREAGVYYTKCLEYWKAFPQVPAPPFQKGRILSKLSFSLIFPFTSVERGMEAAVEALTLAGESWGSDEKAIAEITKKDLMRFVKFWILSHEGRHEIHFKKEKERVLYKEWYPLIREAMFALINVALVDPAITTEMRNMILLKILGFALTEAESNSFNLFNTLLYLIYGLFNHPTKFNIWLARYFSNKSKLVDAKCGVSNRINYFLYGGAEIFLNSHPKKPLKSLISFIARSYCWISAAYISQGKLDIPRLYDNALRNDLVREDTAWVGNSTYGPLLSSFLKGDHEAFAEYYVFQGYIFGLIPAKLLESIRLHRRIFDLMNLMLQFRTHEITPQMVVKALEECDRYLSREPDIAFGYGLLFCLLTTPNLASIELRKVMKDAMPAKLCIYKDHSIQGNFSLFNHFLIQIAAFSLGAAPPPTQFARLLRRARGEWSLEGEFGFLQTMGQAALAIHCPSLMSREIDVKELAHRFKEVKALMLEQNPQFRK
ncbi:hypothetical protein HDU97_005559 [Phlyctochytrium planicorne]|nr:hypothetical protein HDU97_005559 [Phlyctochytrium planicorne]